MVLNEECLDGLDIAANCIDSLQYLHAIAIYLIDAWHDDTQELLVIVVIVTVQVRSLLFEVEVAIIVSFIFESLLLEPIFY